MKPVFNSLGSNYSLGYSLKALQSLVTSHEASLTKLKQYLETEYHGTAYLVYKGRDAIECALKALGIGEGDTVITQAFTCYAIEEAIKRSEATPWYCDLGKGQLNPTHQTLEIAYKTAPAPPKAVLLQHTLGYPADIQAIRTWCTKNNLLLIEDLAQSFGGVDNTGKRLGSTADAIVLSFGRDKILDAVAGGGICS